MDTTTKDEILVDKSLSVPDAGIFSWVLGTDTIYADAAVAALLGFEARQLESGQPITSFLDRIDPKDKAKIARAIHEAIVTGGAYQQDYRVIRPDGTSVEVAAFGRCFRDASGTPSHYAGIICPRIDRRSAQENMFWHCFQAYEIARNAKQWEMAKVLEKALHQCCQDATGSGITSHFPSIH
ncbi:PAS domain-containing protein [Rhizobium mesosinicum]|uniref:PAS domain-containing protein n=1 Tax=Rhizobium mesosinicum TaxID=335017 RepID=A0ABS7GQ36_9HYPH|nr:PAS domain-containing protein [Rhizobium mesosinicum]MBW9051822.1 PAS domain-containing protein [Rhizobium mesosinicum]